MTREITRRKFIGGAGSVGLLIITGCGSGGGASSAGGAPTSGGKLNPKRGRTLVIASPIDIPELDPQNQSDLAQLQIYQAPLRRKAAFGQHEPDLAGPLKISPDGLEYTIDFRRGVTFQDGSGFDANAWVFGMKRQIFASNPYHKGPFGHWASLAGGFPGKLKSITATDPMTAKIVLNEPIANLEYVLADIEVSAAINPATIRKDPAHFGQKPIGAGTGPFKFTERVANDHVTLERNAGYWRKGRPYLDRIIEKVIPDPGAQLLALKSGEIQLMNVPGPEIDQLKNDDKVTLHTFPPYFANYLGFDHADPVTGKKAVRQAICQGIDRAALAKQFSFAKLYPTFGLLPGLPGYNESIRWYPHDPNAAKQLLASAGYPNGIDIKLTFATGIPLGVDSQLLAQAIQGQLAPAGIRVKLNQIDAPTLYQASFGKPGRRNYPYQMTIGLIGTDGDVFGMAQQWTYSTNYAGYHPTYLKGFGKVASEPNARARVSGYMQLQQILYDDVGFVPLVYTSIVQATTKNVHNLVPYYLESAWLS